MVKATSPNIFFKNWLSSEFFFPYCLLSHKDCIFRHHFRPKWKRHALTSKPGHTGALNDKEIYLKSDRGTQLVNREPNSILWKVQIKTPITHFPPSTSYFIRPLNIVFKSSKEIKTWINFLSASKHSFPEHGSDDLKLLQEMQLKLWPAISFCTHLRFRFRPYYLHI